MKWASGRAAAKTPRALAILLACAGAACEPGQGADEDGSDDGADPPSGTCSASEDDYLATYTAVSDNCGGVAAFMSERYSVSSDGEVLTAEGRAIGDGSAPSGCVDDDVSTDECVVSFRRQCATVLPLLGAADVQGDYTLDFESGSGSVDILIAVYDGSTLLQSCQAEQRIRISAR
jgi:hypothetical protein